MRWFFALTFTVGIWSNAHATNSFTISFANPKSRKVDLRVSRYDHGHIQAIDSTQCVSVQCTWTFTDPAHKDPGLYILSVNSAHYFELILSPSETPLIVTTLSEMEQGAFDISGSVENEAYYQFLQQSMIYEDSLRSCELKKNELSYYDPRYLHALKTHENRLFQLQADHNERLMDVRKKYPNTFTTRELTPVMCFPSPTPEDRSRYETNRSFLHHHYFDNYINLSAAALDHYLLYRKIDVYFSEFTEPDSDNSRVIEKLYGKTQHDFVLSNQVFNHLLHRLLSANDDEGLETAYATWHGDGCINESKNSLISDEFITNTLKHTVGKKISEVLLKDQAGNLRSLHGQLSIADLTLLIFWQNQCHTCQEVLPEIETLVGEFSGLALGAFSVCVDDADPMEVAIQHGPAEKWVSVYDSDRVFTEQFAIWQTPTLYILDTHGTVLAKNLFGKDLESFISSYQP